MRLVRVGKTSALGGAFDRGAMNFLEEYNIGSRFGDSIAHGIQYKPAVTRAIAFVDIVRQDVNFVVHGHPANTVILRLNTGLFLGFARLHGFN